MHKGFITFFNVFTHVCVGFVDFINISLLEKYPFLQVSLSCHCSLSSDQGFIKWRKGGSRAKERVGAEGTLFIATEYYCKGSVVVIVYISSYICINLYINLACLSVCLFVGIQ